MKRGRLGIRQSLFFVLLALVITMTVLFVFLVSYTVSRQIETSSLAEMVRTRDSFRELERQRQDMHVRQTALLSELPSLKALMTTNDQPTILDAGKAFWQTSGSDLFALMRADGSTLAVYSNGRATAAADCSKALSLARDNPYRTNLLLVSGRLFEVATEPISFSSGEQERVLGYISTGYELNDRLAATIESSPAGQVVFATPGRVIASTLDAGQQKAFTPSIAASIGREDQVQSISLSGEGYLTTSVLLQPATEVSPPIYLMLLQSEREKTVLLRQLYGGIAGIGLLLLVIGSGMALRLAGTVTRPLETLLHSTRQMGRGEAIDAIHPTGPLELRELRQAFETMHGEVLSAQSKLVESERQATTGRMASSISHDLRHYLSPIYANAEFLTSQTLSEQERKELLGEISDAARGMNELLDAILTFSRTGISVQTAPDSITVAVRRAIAMLQAHPEAHDVCLEAAGLAELEGNIDGKEIQRAVYNLLLNGCQAARQASSSPRVHVTVQQETDRQGKTLAAIRIRDNGAGVNDEIAPRIFEPFISSGKESGIGLGLALVRRIAEAHGGAAGMNRIGGEAMLAETEFFITIPLQPTLAGGLSAEMKSGVAL